jgi:NDP-sugar pyrophosphorylase family protein
MQGVILAAGKGKRLHPITTQRTKAMAPVAGKPIVERVVDLLVANGIRELVVLISPDDQEIAPYLQTARPELMWRFIVQRERLGMAHALSLAAPFLYGDFILSACDNLTPAAHIGELIAVHHARQAQGTLSLMPIDIAHAASTGIVDWQDGWVKRIVEKPTPAAAPSNISSLPLYVFGSRLLDGLPGVKPSPRGEYELQDAIQLLIDDGGRVTGVLTPHRIQLTNVADLLALNRHYLAANGVDAKVYNGQHNAGARLVPPVLIAPDVQIGPECVIGPHVYIEPGCRIGARTHLADAVVLRGTVLADDTEASGVVLDSV